MGKKPEQKLHKSFQIAKNICKADKYESSQKSETK